MREKSQNAFKSLNNLSSVAHLDTLEGLKETLPSQFLCQVETHNSSKQEHGLQCCWTKTTMFQLLTVVEKKKRGGVDTCTLEEVLPISPAKAG